jgi:phosphoglucosamine mutase
VTSATDTSRYFGADGIRGTVNERVTPQLALKIGQAAGIVCRKGNHPIVVGKDTRLPNYMLESVLAGGLLSVGARVFLTGPVPTPGIAMLTRSMRCSLGIMITASCQLYEESGLKLFGPDGVKLSAETEREIEILIDSDLSKKLAKSNEFGRAERIDGVQDRYIEYAKGTVPKGLQLDGIRVIVDCANGAAYKVAPQVLEELGAEVIAVGVTPDGFNINRECGLGTPHVVQNKVRELRADFGFALDGDADRVIVCDKQGELITSDQLQAAFPQWQGDGLVTALQVLALMKNEGKTASEICDRFR